MNDELIRRAERLMLLNRAPGQWNLQPKHPGKFYYQQRELTAEDVRKHLSGEHWIATRVPGNARTDRIVFDLDCKKPEDIPERDERYWIIRRLMGIERKPLVWRTPSVLGIRLAYRVPPTPVEDVAIGHTRGMVPELLRAAGAKPGQGSVETFPSRSMTDRQLFGRNMPLLDAETLEVLPEADLRGSYGEAALRGAIERVEAWYARVEVDLPKKLRDLPPLAQQPDGATGEGPEPEIDRSDDLKVPGPLRRLAVEGLTGPSSRYASEFRVGKAMWRWPDMFKDLGLPPAPRREDVADALASWLHYRTNGHSKEWAHSVRRLGVPEARKEWRDRYLQRNRTDGLAPVDRMLRAAANMGDGRGWPTVHLTPRERDRIRKLVVAANNRAHVPITYGASAYRFEIWTSCFLRTFKEQLRRGGESGSMEERTAQIASKWMESWPSGKRYRIYREFLEERDEFAIRKVHWRNPHPDLPGQARIYAGPEPDWIRLRDLPLLPADIRSRLEGEMIDGRQLTVDEGLHALYVTEKGRNLEKLYGAGVADRIKWMARLIRNPSAFVREQRPM